jgi:hypothetical protein
MAAPDDRSKENRRTDRTDGGTVTEGETAAEDGRLFGLVITLLVGPGAFFLGIPFVDAPADGLFLLTVSAVLFLVSALAEFTDPS